ncbi:ABC transporter ATP-binding protein [Acetobacterium sp. KB-1]|jgi:oligopeptide/dipeptide ABC transporter ATP-binding protein|uniref:ABC transporter ATP-binding protein n=1 Tax=Acetobacterium TaxID=33951 RepID=UPI000DBECD6F|nr:ABC transporter ATP-binding protein [Acetobacterium sp. KB-1]AWW27588.1 ABC transporter ATP-binding protein [Acetobacterium sp. KB-1]
MLIRVENLCKHYKTGNMHAKQQSVLEQLNFSIAQGQTLGLIGESGCGKSTLARTMLGLTPPSGGKIFLNEQEVLTQRGSLKKEFCGKMQIIFQHPESALNPRMKIAQSLAEPRRIQQRYAKNLAAQEDMDSLLKQVGLSEEHLSRYPHELSGGQIQRVVLARILSLNPEFLVADEPTSMLDVSVQAQVLHILKENQKKHGIGLLFISHDLEVVRWMSDQIAVMYKGQIVEMAPAADLYNHPRHPYSQLLVESSLAHQPVWETKNTEPLRPEGGNGCQFFQHCCQSEEACKNKPALHEKAPGHTVACWKASL